MGFVLLSEYTAIIFINSFNRLIFEMETHCVFFEIGTEFLNIIYMGSMLQRVKKISCELDSSGIHIFCLFQPLSFYLSASVFQYSPSWQAMFELQITSYWIRNNEVVMHQPTTQGLGHHMS
jgi:hypothetical protein